MTARISGVRLHDFNCGFKAYRREIFDTVELYGELHRYVPVLAHALGYRVAEIPVRHHARRYGKSKYGVARYLRGFLDLLTVVMLTRFAYRPGHLFGGIGALFLLGGGAVLAYLAGLKLFTGASIGGRPLLLFGVLVVIVGMQLVLFGMLAELILSRTQRPVEARKLVCAARRPPARMRRLLSTLLAVAAHRGLPLVPADARRARSRGAPRAPRRGRCRFWPPLRWSPWCSGCARGASP